MTYVTLVLAEYCGTKATYQSLAPEHSKTKETLAASMPMLKSLMGGDSETQRWMKEEVARRKQMKLFCEHCLKVEDKENGKMAACGSCKKIGREVRYCGRVGFFSSPRLSVSQLSPERLVRKQLGRFINEIAARFMVRLMLAVSNIYSFSPQLLIPFSKMRIPLIVADK